MLKISDHNSWHASLYFIFEICIDKKIKLRFFGSGSGVVGSVLLTTIQIEPHGWI